MPDVSGGVMMENVRNVAVVLAILAAMVVAACYPPLTAGAAQ